MFKFDVPNQKTTSNVKHEASNASGTFFDTGAGTFDFGDVAAAGSSTKVNLDDSAKRIVLSCQKPVIGDDANNGRIYRWNGATSTYWFSELNGAGLETWTDTTSGSLP